MTKIEDSSLISCVADKFVKLLKLEKTVSGILAFNSPLFLRCKKNGLLKKKVWFFLINKSQISIKNIKIKLLIS